ncbi:MAG: ATP-binding protein [Bacillota bacterium]|jgi:serine/threonine-protein kinase RsbW
MIYRYQKTVAEFDFETMNREVETFCARHAVPGNKLYAVQLIIEELVTNIIKYGNGEMIAITVAKETEGLKLTVTDNSAPFNPLEAEPPDLALAAEERHAGGLGLFLVGKMVKSLNYEHKDGCNVLTADI